MDEWENSVPRGPKRRESEPTVDDLNLHKTYDSYKPSYDSYKPRDQPSLLPRRRPTAEEYWDQRSSPVTFAPRKSRLQENSVEETSDLRSEENTSIISSLGGSRRSNGTLLAASGDSSSTRKDQDGIGVERRDVNRSSVMDVDNPGSGLPKRSRPDGLHVNTELTKTFGSKITDSKAQTPTAVMDPRLTPREGVASAPLSGNATPQSASMETDTLITGHLQTGGKTTAGTVVKPFSFPLPHARVNNDNEKDNAAKRLSKNLSFFAHSVTETASLAIRRDIAQSKAIKTERESKKWQNLQVDYASLAEEQAKAVKTLKDAADRVDERLLKFRQAQDDAVKTMAVTMVSVSSATTSHGARQDNSRVKVLEGEVKELKEALKTITSSLEYSKTDQTCSKSKDGISSRHNSEFQDIVIDPKNIRNQLGQIRGFQTVLNRSDERISVLESHLEKLERSHATIAQIRDVQKQVADLQGQLDSTKVTKDNLSGFEAEISSLTQSLQILNEEVIGTYENDSTNNHKSRITRFQEEMAEFTRELSAKMEKTHMQTAHVASLATASNTDVSQRLETSLAEVAQVAKDLAAVVSDQKVKDEWVAQEVERLDQAIVGMQADLSKTRTDLVKMRADLSETSTNLQTQNTTALPAQVMTNAAYLMQSQQPNINRMSPHDGTITINPPDTQSKLLDDYNDRLVACESVLGNLQQRYDNLSTAELARNMVHQMSTMYPYPAQVLGQLEQLGRNYNTLIQNMAVLSGNFAALSNRVDTLAQTPAAQQDAASHKLHLSMHDEKIKSLEARFTALPQRSATPSNPVELATKSEMEEQTASLHTQLAALKADLEENSLGLKDINKVLDIAKNQYQSTVASLQSDLQKISEVLKTKLSVTEHDTFNNLVETHVKEIYKRLDEKEDVAAEELGKMHEEVTAVMKYLGMPYRGESQEPDSEGDKDDDQIALEPVATSPSPAVTLPQVDDSMSEDSDPVRQPSLGRSLLTKKKHEHKRKRHSKGSESETNPKRKLKSGK
ncbi:hypothetical protein MMC30_001426 [Trapelia coarctata]|nr:hypothetical protein [Trapelia coarctata]